MRHILANSDMTKAASQYCLMVTFSSRSKTYMSKLQKLMVVWRFGPSGGGPAWAVGYVAVGSAVMMAGRLS